MTTDDVDPVADAEARIQRLERRLDRERRARLEAEEIAEAGMRSLYEANQALDRRILERTQELHQALQTAESANNAKSWFLSQMSHQINTPLNGLMGMLELLASEFSDEQAREWHGSAMRSARRLQRLTTRLISYVELERVDLLARSEARPLSVVLGHVHERWHGPCLRAGQLLAIELQPGSDVLIPSPPELDLLFDELMSNVVEHATAGSVTLWGGRHDDEDRAVIRIQDPGPGVDQRIIARAHSLSAEADQSQRGDDPVNLGFALVDRIASGLGAQWGPVGNAQSAIAISLPVVAESPIG